LNDFTFCYKCAFKLLSRYCVHRLSSNPADQKALLYLARYWNAWIIFVRRATHEILKLRRHVPHGWLTQVATDG
jgi:hypothetical protein